MITLDEALDCIRGTLSPVSAETVDLHNAHGRVLAATISAKRTQPPFAASAMDGYAVRSADLVGSATRLQLCGESAAGHSSNHPVGAGQAMRISTGAPVPDGADQVVIQEKAEKSGEFVTLSEAADPGRNIRKAGIDFHQGDVLLEAGRRLTPAAISLAASGGFKDLVVARRPHVGILSTGDELVEPGMPSGPDQIVNSLGVAMEGYVREWGGDPVYLGLARDNPDDIRSRLAGIDALDLMVAIGGASVGDHDHLRRVFSEEGGRLLFEKIAVKPGKPTWFGALGSAHIVGLPGNPVSALIMARLCLRSALSALTGEMIRHAFSSGVLGEAIDANGPRENFVRGRIDARTGRIFRTSNQDSSALSALLASDCLIRRPANAAAAKLGERVEVLPLGPA